MTIHRVLLLCLAPLMAALFGWPVAAVFMALAAVPSRLSAIKRKESNDENGR
jgi:hypothetical protein